MIIVLILAGGLFYCGDMDSVHVRSPRGWNASWLGTRARSLRRRIEKLKQPSLTTDG